jgi:hypothetical protein
MIPPGFKTGSVLESKDRLVEAMFEEGSLASLGSMQLWLRF